MSKYCIAIIADEAFLPGSTVLLSSFLQHNPWFDGDIVVIHDDSCPSVLEALDKFPRVRAYAVGHALRARLHAVAAAHPWLIPKIRIFFSLESYILPYHRIVYMDADMLCQGDARELFEHEAPLLCCPDQCYFRGLVRNRQSYVPQAQRQSATDVFPITFSAGMMSIAPAGLGPGTYDRLMERVDPAGWNSVRSGHSDSVLLNSFFEGRWTRVSERYNYLISDHSAEFKVPRVSMNEAVLLHYLRTPKPWQPHDRSGFNEDRREAFGRWESYVGSAASNGTRSNAMLMRSSLP